MKGHQMNSIEMDSINKLLQLKELFEKGIITKEELEIEKSKILSDDKPEEKNVTISPKPTPKAYQSFKRFVKDNDITIAIASILVVLGIIIIPIIIQNHRRSEGPKSSIKQKTTAVKEPSNEVIEPYLEELQEEEMVPVEVIPFNIVQVKPKFNGGDANEFSKWVNSRLVYPEIAKEKGIQGRVTLQFTITSQGDVIGVEVKRGVDESLDKEAVRVVSSSPRWQPGKHHGEDVYVSYTFPVIFQLR